MMGLQADGSGFIGVYLILELVSPGTVFILGSEDVHRALE